MPIFEPPTVNDVPTVYVVWPDRYYPVSRVAQRLRSYYGPNPRGRSVLKIAGTYQTIDVPSQDQIDSATEVYLGGHLYEVTQTVADALAAAGYTVS